MSARTESVERRIGRSIAEAIERSRLVRQVHLDKPWRFTPSHAHVYPTGAQAAPEENVSDEITIHAGWRIDALFTFTRREEDDFSDMYVVGDRLLAGLYAAVMADPNRGGLALGTMVTDWAIEQVPTSLTPRGELVGVVAIEFVTEADVRMGDLTVAA